jgi:hypothetical protein
MLLLVHPGVMAGSTDRAEDRVINAIVTSEVLEQELCAARAALENCAAAVFLNHPHHFLFSVCALKVRDFPGYVAVGGRPTFASGRQL